MPRLSNELIDQINAANDIVELVQGYFPLKRAGAMWKARCPFHQENTPSFTVNPQRQMYKCFGCGAGGGPIKFVMQYENLDFHAAARKLAERGGIRVEDGLMSAEDEAKVSMRRRLLALHAEAAEFFHQQLMKKPSAQVARDYLKGRGIGSDVAKSWKIGFAPDEWDSMRELAHAQRFSEEELLESGLVKTRDEDRPRSEFYDRFRGRVMFPICNDTGEVIGFSGRVLAPDAKAAKYINSPETMLFVKGAVLFGLHKSKRALIDRGSVIVCEGQLDLITAFEAGVQNVVAPQGTAFTERQARKLKQYCEEVVLCFDADLAGEKAAERSLDALLAASLAVRVATMPEGEDPDSLIRGKGADAFRERIAAAKDYFDFVIDRETAKPEFATTRGRVVAVRKLAGAISKVSDVMLRTAITNRASERLEVSPQEFARLLTTPKIERPDPSPEALQPRLEFSKAISNLLLVALCDADARLWLQEQAWEEIAGVDPNEDLLEKVLLAEVEVTNPVSVNSFLTSLTDQEQDAVVDVLENGLIQSAAPSSNDKVFAKPDGTAGTLWFPMLTANDVWRAISRERVRHRLDACQVRLRQLGLQPDEVSKLQKEVLDLKSHLANLGRLFSPPL
ncbi:MAG: DNA primase [Chthoniobacteraceae bacterium]